MIAFEVSCLVTLFKSGDIQQALKVTYFFYKISNFRETNCTKLHNEYGSWISVVLTVRIPEETVNIQLIFFHKVIRKQC